MPYWDLTQEELEWISYHKASGFLMQTEDEAQSLYRFAKYVTKIPGHCAEVGVCHGGSTEVIARGMWNFDKVIHLFDTFECVPEGKDFVSEYDKEGSYHNSCPSTLDGTKKRLEYIGNRLEYHVGLFEETCVEVENKKFSLAHFDADLYCTCLSFMDFFYSRMNPGGVMIFHDVGVWPGILPAILEFFDGKPENIVHTTSSQAVVVKSHAYIHPAIPVMLPLGDE